MSNALPKAYLFLIKTMRPTQIDGQINRVRILHAVLHCFRLPPSHSWLIVKVGQVYTRMGVAGISSITSIAYSSDVSISGLKTISKWEVIVDLKVVAYLVTSFSPQVFVLKIGWPLLKVKPTHQPLVQKPRWWNLARIAVECAFYHWYSRLCWLETRLTFPL
jgi:hypothetical protein